MQLVIPHEAVWAWVDDAVAPREVTDVDVSGDIEGCSAIQVGGRVVIHVSDLFGS